MVRDLLDDKVATSGGDTFFFLRMATNQGKGQNN